MVKKGKAAEAFYTGYTLLPAKEENAIHEGNEKKSFSKEVIAIYTRNSIT